MSFPIHDLYVRPLTVTPNQVGSTLEILRYSDHLLRRFGLAEMVVLGEGQARPEMLNEVADEVWALVDGSVEFSWRDLRTSSPSHEASYQMRYEEPTLVLAPFGVEFGIRAVAGPAQLIRLSTHEEDK